MWRWRQIDNVAVIWVALTTMTLLTVISAVGALTVAPADKIGAGKGDRDGGALNAGSTERWRSRSGAAALTVKGTAEVVPPAVVTVTLRAPEVAAAAMVNVAVIWVALTTATLLTVTPVEETVTVAPAMKFAPVRVTGTLAPWAPFTGAMEVRPARRR